MKRLLMYITAVLVVFAACSVAWSETLPVQFRLGEKEPGRNLEEMTVSGTDQKVYLYKESVLSNADVKTASTQETMTGIGIDITFTEAGGKKLAEITKDNVGKIMGIVVDGELITAPVIRASITGGKAFIAGNFNLEEAKKIAKCFEKETGEPVFSTELKRYKETVTGIVAFDDINLITMRDNKIIPSQTVIVRDGIIVKIGNSSGIAIPKEAKIVIGNGKKYLMPGLADMHVHLNDSRHLKLLVANGVTTVRNMWGTDFQLKIREDINSKQRVGPVIYSTGPLMDGDPPIWPGSAVIKTAKGAKNAVRKTKEDGFEFVKVYNGLSEEVYDTIMSTARDLNIPVVGHIPAAVGFDKAVAFGQYSFEHLYGATRNARDWRTPHKGNELEEYLKKTVASGVWNCPTLVVFKSSEMKRDELKKQPALKYMRRGTIEWWERGPSKNLSDEMRQSRLDMVKALHDAGANLILGTDFPNPWVIPGFSLHEELSLMVEAGLSPYEAIKTGTVNAAVHMMKQDEFGTVEEGKRADLILIERNPFEDVRSITKPLGVMTNGVWYPRSMLDQMLHEVEQETKRLDGEVNSGI